MLPPVGGMPQDNEGVAQQQSSRRSGIFDNIQNSFATSSKFFAQESLVKTLGNNFVTQVIMQTGNILGDVLDKITRQDENYDVEPGQGGPGLSDLDRNLFKEMLKTLLRIEENTESGPSSTPFDPKVSSNTISMGSDRVKSERRSAEDILERINQKSPMQPVKRDKSGNIISEHYSDIGQNITNTAATGLYETLGYNVLSQGAVDTLGLAGDLSGRLLDKFGKDASNDPNISAEKGLDVDREVLTETKESKTVLRSMLEKLTEISDTFKKYFSNNDEPISTLEDTFEDSKIGKPVPQPALPKDLLDKIRPSSPAAAAASAASGGDSLLSKAGDVAEIASAVGAFKGGKAILGKLGKLGARFGLPGMSGISSAAGGVGKAVAGSSMMSKIGGLATKFGMPIIDAASSVASSVGNSGTLSKAGEFLGNIADPKNLKGGKSILGRLGGLASKFSMPGGAAMGTAAAAAAPLAAMAYAAHKAGDQTHDIENVESLKGKSEGISGFFKKIGLDFSGRFEKQAAKNREGLDTTEELESVKRASNVESLEKSADKLRESEKESRKLFGDTIKQDIANITNINNQTVIPTRTTVRHTETTANRYFDKALN